ncbi:MAG: aspartate/glutamate racemase family protein [Alphaproteobacteria bacterium]|jgi:allantoin racemase|nr:aspartate/glutamate racemase family protein [Alphaproteobacteria bacterium]
MKVLYQLTSPMEKTLGVEEMERRLSVLKSYAGADTEVSIRSIPHGPGSIESSYDAAIVVPDLLHAVREAERDDFSATIVGCFSDPGLEPMREVVEMPVVGPGASAMHLAAQLGSRFSIISPSDGGGGRVRARLRAMGLADKFASVRGISMSVLDLAQQREATLDRIAGVGRNIAEEDGADVLVLGCMSMAFLEITDDLQERTGMPVVNPVCAALKTAEMMVDMRLSHSKAAYPVPPEKEVY